MRLRLRNGFWNGKKIKKEEPPVERGNRWSGSSGWKYCNIEKYSFSGPISPIFYGV